MCHYRSNIKKRNCVEIPPLVPVPTSREVRGLATCAIGPSYFVYLTSNYTNLLSYLRDGSETNSATVRMNYCKPSENLNNTQSFDWTYQVTGSIVSTQNILNGFTVRYKAGSFIELNNGFISGTDFIAEIDPCVITRTTIAAKTDDIEIEQSKGEDGANYDIQLRIYPTVLPSGQAIKIMASQGLENLEIAIYDLNARPVVSNRIADLQQNAPYNLNLPTLASGFYIVKVQSSTLLFTQKIVIQ